VIHGAGIHRATHAGPVCNCDPLRAGTRWRCSRGGIDRATQPEPVCNCDPLRARIHAPTHTRGRVAAAIRCGPVLDGVAPVGESIEQHSPSRFAVVIRCGPVPVAVPSMDRMRAGGARESHAEPGCSCDPLRARFHAPTHTPGRVAVVIHGAGTRWRCSRG
jgi:hypothetical protein